MRGHTAYRQPSPCPHLSALRDGAWGPRRRQESVISFPLGREQGGLASGAYVQQRAAAHQATASLPACTAPSAWLKQGPEGAGWASEICSGLVPQPPHCPSWQVCRCTSRMDVCCTWGPPSTRTTSHPTLHVAPCSVKCSVECPAAALPYSLHSCTSDKWAPGWGQGPAPGRPPTPNQPPSLPWIYIYPHQRICNDLRC